MLRPDRYHGNYISRHDAVQSEPGNPLSRFSSDLLLCRDVCTLDWFDDSRICAANHSGSGRDHIAAVVLRVLDWIPHNVDLSDGEGVSRAESGFAGDRPDG